MADVIENPPLSEQEPIVSSNREGNRASPKLGRRAVVVGAGIGRSSRDDRSRPAAAASSAAS
jgi:hypothetical protein